MINSSTPRTKRRAPAVLFSTKSTGKYSPDSEFNVPKIDGAVNNAVQNLLILGGDSTRAPRFMTEAISRARQPAPLLGYTHWRAIGKPFPTMVHGDGAVTAWCEPLAGRTARSNCIAKTVARIAAFYGSAVQA